MPDSVGPFVKGYVQGRIVGDAAHTFAGWAGERHGRRKARQNMLNGDDEYDDDDDDDDEYDEEDDNRPHEIEAGNRDSDENYCEAHGSVAFTSAPARTGNVEVDRMLAERGITQSVPITVKPTP